MPTQITYSAMQVGLAYSTMQPPTPITIYGLQVQGRGA
jgi:hypothetical protein